MGSSAAKSPSTNPRHNPTSKGVLVAAVDDDAAQARGNIGRDFLEETNVRTKIADRTTTERAEKYVKEGEAMRIIQKIVFNKLYIPPLPITNFPHLPLLYSPSYTYTP